ncbi:MAG: hypothetical protein BMS9Abin34_030 [Patescibacteria group bacterium]|nr:MAG: hypothetical protein BMS9Abin34_030 [Patescibacteria group bacterium]
MIKKIKAAVAAGTGLIASTALVFAEEDASGITNPLSKVNSFGDLITIAFNAILLIVGALALILLAVGGIQYMTSGGDKFAVEKARGRITAAIVGLLIVFGAWLVINILGGLLGVENILEPGI